MGKYKVLTDRLNTYFTYNKITTGTAAPTAGNHIAGDIVVSKSANSSSFGWVCMTSGTPGTWKILKSGNDITKGEVEKVLTGLITSHTHNYAGSSSAGGAANSAVKLQTARNITVGNTSRSFDGTGNVSWSLSEIGALPTSGGTVTGVVHFNNGVSQNFKTATSLTNANTGATIAAGTSLNMITYNNNHNLHIGSGIFDNGINTGSTYISGGAAVYLRTATTSGTLNFNFGGTTNATVTKNGFNGTLNGNASTATKLQTARSINGTNFDGADNITTANWGTARTLTIGSIGKSVNGSGNISWSLSEIGAAPTSHKHELFDISGGNNSSNPLGTIYCKNNAKTHANRVSCYHNTDSASDYASIGLYDITASSLKTYVNMYPNYVYTNKPIQSAANYIELGGKKFTISTGAPSGPSTGDIWVDI